MNEQDLMYMKMAFAEAQKAWDAGEVPVGAVIVCNGKVIARAYNQTELLHDVTAHAEMLAITAAANYLGAKYLNDCTLYVTLEPCVMCAGAIAWSQMAALVYAADDAKRGFSILNSHVLHPKTQLRKGVLKEECSHLVKSFFENKR